jgi:hypothetical protein
MATGANLVVPTVSTAERTASASGVTMLMGWDPVALW